jgi:hypothetical protein
VVKVIVFYWEPGSCGDFVNSLLLSQSSEYQSVTENFTRTDQGRLRPKISKFFVEQFDHVPYQWYLRTWSVEDCKILREFIDTLDCDSFLIPTHRMNQVEFLQSQFSDSITMGITYPKNMFPLVLKNWCKKVAPTDVSIQETYSHPLHNYFKTKNRFGEIVLSDQLKYGTEIKSHVEEIFNISISLEDLYNHNLHMVESLLDDSSHIEQQYTNWIQNQNHFYSYQYDLPSILYQALGYNSRSTRPGNLNYELDIFDNILITHYCKTYTSLSQIPRFSTLQQASTFFKHTNKTDNYVDDMVLQQSIGGNSPG